jgi:hypothetical protein
LHPQSSPHDRNGHHPRHPLHCQRGRAPPGGCTRRETGEIGGVRVLTLALARYSPKFGWVGMMPKPFNMSSFDPANRATGADREPHGPAHVDDCGYRGTWAL